MIKMQLEILGKSDNGTKIIFNTITIEQNESFLQLTPEYLISLDSEIYSAKSIYGFNAYIFSVDGVLEIYDFEYITLEAFRNTAPKVSTLKVVGAKNSCNINNVEIRKFDISDSNFILDHCEIYEIDVGLHTAIHSKIYSKKNIKNIDTEFSGDIIDSDIKELRGYVPLYKLEIQNSYVKRIVLDSESSCENLYIYENCIVNRLSLLSKVKLFKLKNSAITDFEFRTGGQVEEIEFEYYSVTRIHNCSLYTIKEKSTDAWRLIMESAKLDDNGDLYSKAGFEYMKCQRDKLPFGIQKLGYYLIEKTSGYGFRPSFTIRFSFVVWILFAISFWSLTIYFNEGLSTIKATKPQTLFNCFYYSAITFTTVGYGDLVPQGNIAKIFASVEPIVGSAMMALFIFSLTKRYGSLK